MASTVPHSRGGASLADLRAEAAYAAQRVAFYRRRVNLGRGDPVRLAELERTAAGAAARVRRAAGDGPPAPPSTARRAPR